ncbi:hypothetical protein [Zoogloea sp.]|uniref:hypothetical protein n=1 Tax=Zoogloea sp. TaxID=49181 RepID=UPI002D1FA13E|nr:hypothetical protein [Zoogloea sp.]
MNLHGSACPACGGKPISLWRKLCSRPGRSFACQSCGTPLRLGMPGFRQFLLPAFVGTLASFAPGILAGVGIFILAVALLARGLPVEAAPAESASPKSSPALVSWLLGVFAAGALSLGVNFFPAPEVAMAGLGAAILMSYLMTRSLWVNRVGKEERALLYPVWFLLLVFMHYLSFAAVLPAWPAYQLGETRTFQARVVHKGGSHRLGACKTQIRLNAEGIFSNWRICLPEAQWNGLKEGDAVVVTSASSWLGDYVLHVVPAAGAAGR